MEDERNARERTITERPKFYRGVRRAELFAELRKRIEDGELLFQNSVYMKHDILKHCWEIRCFTKDGEGVFFYADQAFSPKLHTGDEREALFQKLLEHAEKDGWRFRGSIWILNPIFGAHCYEIRFEIKPGIVIPFFTDLGFPKDITSGGKLF